MSFWFEPARTPPTEEQRKLGHWEPDLHPTDKEFISVQLSPWANGCPEDGESWGSKHDAYTLGYLLGKDFKQYINKWAPPDAVEGWGHRLVEMASNHMLADNDYYKRYGEFLIALGRRGVGVGLSW